MVGVAVVLTLVYYNTNYLHFKAALHKDLDKYAILKDIRERISFCYGQEVLEEELLHNPCDIPETYSKGYRIEQLAFGNGTCLTMSWDHGMVNSSHNSFSYLVAIQQKNSSLVCPGKLKVYI